MHISVFLYKTNYASVRLEYLQLMLQRKAVPRIPRKKQKGIFGLYCHIRA